MGNNLEMTKRKTKKKRESERLYHRLFADKLSPGIEFRKHRDMRI